MSRNNQTLIKHVVSNCYFYSTELQSVSGDLKCMKSVSCMALEIYRNVSQPCSVWRITILLCH